MTQQDLQFSLIKLAEQSGLAPETDAFLEGMAKEADLLLEQHQLQKRAFFNNAIRAVVKEAHIQGISSTSPECLDLIQKLSEMQEPEELIQALQKNAQDFQSALSEQMIKEGYDQAFVDGMIKEAGLFSAVGALPAVKAVARGFGSEGRAMLGAATSGALTRPIGKDSTHGFSQWWKGVKGDARGLANEGLPAAARVPGTADAGEAVAKYLGEMDSGLAGLAKDSPHVQAITPMSMARRNTHMKWDEGNIGPHSVKADSAQSSMLGAGQAAERAAAEAEARALAAKWYPQFKRDPVGTHGDPLYRQELEALFAKHQGRIDKGFFGAGGKTGLTAQLGDLRNSYLNNGNPDMTRDLLKQLASPAGAKMEALSPGLAIPGAHAQIADPRAYAAAAAGRGVGSNRHPVSGFLGGTAASIPAGMLGAAAGGALLGPPGAFVGGLLGGGAGWKLGKGVAGRLGVGKTMLGAGALGAGGMYLGGKAVMGQSDAKDAQGLPVDRNRAVPFMKNNWAGAAGGALLASTIARELGLDAGAMSWILPLLGGVAGYNYLPQLMNKWQDPNGYGVNAVPEGNTQMTAQTPFKLM